MHILFICSEYPPSPHGGIGVFTKTLAEALVNKGYNAAVIGYDSNVEATITQDEKGVKVRRLKMPMTFRHITIGRFSLSLEPYLIRRELSHQLEIFVREIKPDLIESFDWSGPLWNKPSIPLVVRLHGANSAHRFYEGKRMSKILSFCEKKNILMADKLVSVSNHIAEITLKSLSIKGKKCVTIYNMVDMEIFKPMHGNIKDQNKLLYVGRIDRRKGVDCLIKCCNILFSIHSGLYLDIVGGGESSYIKYLKELVLPEFSDRIKFIGKVAHDLLPNVYRSAVLFIMPSKAEAFGLTAIEAMSCGTPVFLTNRASGPEMVQDGKDGWLIDMDKPNDAATKIYKVLSNYQIREEVASRAILRVRNCFSTDKLLYENIELYNSIL